VGRRSPGWNVSRNGSLIAALPAATTTYKATRLTNGTVYEFTVAATNSKGTGFSASAAVTPAGPPGKPARPRGSGTPR